MLARGSSGQSLGADVNYWTQIFPFIVLMALGMGAVFVPLTLTAVHHVRAEDSGIGSGVLNTMQQVGGALGLAILSTVAVHFAQAKTDQLVPALHQLAPQLDPSAVGGLAGLAGVHHRCRTRLPGRRVHDLDGQRDRVDLPRT